MLEGFIAAGRLARQGWRWAVGIAGGDGPQPGLLLPHLTGRRHDASILIQQEEIAAAAHQFHHQGAADGLARPWGELQLHHPLPARLLQCHQGQPPQAVLQLLGQGAAVATAGRWRDGEQPGGFGLPAEFQPCAPLQAAKAELQGVGIGLLGFLEAAGHQLRRQFRQHRPQGGEIHGLEGQGGHGGDGMGSRGAPTLQARG